MPDLVLFSDSCEVIRFPLTIKGLSIGRSSSNDVVLTDESISRFHARLNFSDNKYWVKSFGSAGTLINGKPISDHPLQDGDEIRIGVSLLKFRQNGAEDESREASVMTCITRTADDGTQVLSGRLPDAPPQPATNSSGSAGS